MPDAPVVSCLLALGLLAGVAWPASWPWAAAVWALKLGADAWLLWPLLGLLRRRRWLGAWMLGASAFLVLGNPELRSAALAPVEHAVELAGFGLQQVSVSGHRFTADTDIYAALDLDSARTLLSFDARAARALPPTDRPIHDT